MSADRGCGASSCGNVGADRRRGLSPLVGQGLFLGLLAWGALAGAARAQEGPAVEPPAEVLAAEQARVAAIAKAKAAAVCVFGPGGAGGGSGVVITPDGYALSNFHVTKPSGDHMRCGMADGELYDAVIVGVDPVGDVALIKLLGRNDFPTAELGDSDAVRVGDWCFAVGNPFLLATDFDPTVTYGIVSGVRRYQYPAGTLLEYADCVQTDASINPGNSGGPLFNAQGQLIGVNGRGSFEKRGRVNVGVGYAISINQIKNFLGHLRSGRVCDHATLGASVATDEQGRVVVTNILDGSDAYRRGLRYGDEILAFGGRPIQTVNAFKNALGIYPKGWRVPLVYRQEGERRETWVRLAGVHTQEELLEKAQGGPREAPRPEPEKKEGDKPDGDKQPAPPKEPPKEHPPIALPLPRATPPHVAKLIKPKRGYANFHFNELERDRVWSAFQAGGDYATLRGAWTITGAVAGPTLGEGPAEFTLADKGAGGKLPKGLFVVDMAKDLDQQVDPPGTGGLLLALQMWRRLLTQGPAAYGDVYYLGTAPIPTRPALVDVLSATHDVVETNFLFDPASGEMLGLEMFPDAGVDPCELYFSDYRDVAGKRLPHLVEIRLGTAVIATLRVAKFDLAK